MPHPVLDLGSNLEENLKRWSNALKGLGAKFAVWEVIYSGKRKWWTAKEISNKLKGKVSPKRVTEVGKKLLGDGLVHQVTDRYPIVYEKILRSSTIVYDRLRKKIYSRVLILHEAET